MKRASILAATVLFAFSASPAFADRQGGGGLMKVAMVLDGSGFNQVPALMKPIEFPALAIGAPQSATMTESVRFKTATSEQLTFEYVSAALQAAEITIRRQNLAPIHGQLLNALGESKLTGSWVPLEKVENR